jgi:hypothetical protein
VDHGRARDHGHRSRAAKALIGPRGSVTVDVLTGRQLGLVPLQRQDMPHDRDQSRNDARCGGDAVRRLFGRSAPSRHTDPVTCSRVQRREREVPARGGYWPKLQAGLLELCSPSKVVMVQKTLEGGFMQPKIRIHHSTPKHTVHCGNAVRRCGHAVRPGHAI